VKVYTGSFTAPAGENAYKNVEMEPGDYPVWAWATGVVLTSPPVLGGDSWAETNNYQLNFDNTTGAADVTVNYAILVGPSPTEWVAYTGP
jgi:hypothetical protein